MDKLVQKFLENRCTAEESEKVLRWLQTEAGVEYLKKRVTEDGHLFFNTTGFDNYPELDSRKLFEEIIKKRKSEKHTSANPGRFPENHLPKKKHGSIYKWKFLSLAAAALFLIVTVIMNRETGESSSDSEEVASYQLVETARGEQKTIRLQDGSTVMLNHDSHLSIPDNYSETNRQISLNGEAWFEVVQNAQNPFTVFSSNSIVTVLGTSFTMKSHQGEEQTRVVVTEGKVALGAKENTAVEEKIIQKNQEGVLITGEQIKLQEVADPEQFTGWRDGKLIFHTTPFVEVAKRLERWYDVKCIIREPAIEEEYFTAVFENEPLGQVLEVISLSMNIHYEMENRTIIFKTNNL